MTSRIWIKAFIYIFFIVAGCTLAISLYTIPVTRDITYRMEEKYAIGLLDRVQNLVEAKHQQIEGYRRAAMEARKRELKHITEVVGGYLEAEHQAALADPADSTRIQRRTLSNTRRFLYGDRDYIWISDFASVLISHPDPKLYGADFSGVRDVKGDLIVPPMVQVARENGEGYTSYWWNRLGREKPSEKLTYSRLFAPWQWVYGTGVYIDDIEEEVERRRRELIGQLREMMSTITIGATGYMYIFDTGLNVIIHPNKQLEGKNFGTMIEPRSGRPIAELLVAAAKTGSGKLAYRWDRPEEPGRYVYDKLSWVRYFPGFKWYIASSVYQDELLTASRRLSWRIATIALSVCLIALASAYVLLKRFVRPIEQLSRTALKVRQGDLSVRSGLSRGDEIGILAVEFDKMVAALADHVNILDTRVQEKTAELRENLSKLEDANAQIIDGIEYARTIQRALLPSGEVLGAALADHFVIYRPKDIIGGDLYWFQDRPEGALLAVMDCTGHGVPGAVMTTIAATCLRQSLDEKGSADPARILQHLNGLVRRMLGQHHPRARSDDGLDMALCRLNPGGGGLTFAGARLGLFVARNGVVEEFKGDRRSIGYRSSASDFSFRNQEVALAPEDVCFMASDGFWDQAGGRRGFPFGRKRFQGLLAQCHRFGCEDQKRRIETALADYQGACTQRDDMTLLGFRIKPPKGEE